MKIQSSTCRVAVVQCAPIMFDKKQTMEKVFALLREASAQGAALVVFPELTVPGYPVGMTYGFRVGMRIPSGRQDWKLYYDNSLYADGEELCALRALARELSVYVSFGYSEKDPSNATLYNSNMMISPDGTYKNHRKLKPTGSERVVWGDANKDYFPTLDSPWGPMGSLICWESYMPLARVALYQKGITLYLAPTTNDYPEWHETVHHIAMEGHCYLINCNPFFTKDMYPSTAGAAEEIAALPPIVCRGGSSIVDPYGHDVAGPLWDREGILYAELDMEAVIASRMELDVTGHYARPDILHLEVRGE